MAAPVDSDGYTIDLDRLRPLAREVRPKLITVGGSLNLFEHPIREVRAIADALVLLQDLEAGAGHLAR